ncbi:unnamed protein product, partial [Closterium sp. NIES-54]
MEATGAIQWLDEGVVPFLKPKFGVQSRSAMLVLDSYRGHLTKEVKARFAALNIVPAVIPAGCTADVQPLDVSVNKSFKASPTMGNLLRAHHAQQRLQLLIIHICSNNNNNNNNNINISNR